MCVRVLLGGGTHPQVEGRTSYADQSNYIYVHVLDKILRTESDLWWDFVHINFGDLPLNCFFASLAQRYQDVLPPLKQHRDTHELKRCTYHVYSFSLFKEN